MSQKDNRRQKWSLKCKREFAKNALICMDHFHPSSIVKTSNRTLLLNNAEPIVSTFEQNLTNSNVVEMDVATGPINLPEHQEPGASCSISNYTLNECNTEEPVASDFNLCNVEDNLVDSGVSIAINYTIPNYADMSTQTEPVILDYTVDRQNFLRKVRILETEIKNLKCEMETKLKEANAAIESMRSIFTEGQIRKLQNPQDIKWKWEDISSAICLHASGPRAYKHLYNKGFPLPHVSTLQRWCRKVNITEGILTTAIDFMRQISDLEQEEKLCVLTFDEMKVVETFEYDAVADVVRKPVTKEIKLKMYTYIHMYTIN